MGEFGKDKFPGEFMDAWRAALKNENFESVRHFLFCTQSTLDISNTDISKYRPVSNDTVFCIKGYSFDLISHFCLHSSSVFSNY